MPCTTPLSQLPGDPSLIVHTNVDLGDKKTGFMTAASAAIAQCLGKPETYVSVCVLDKQDMIFGGSAAPCALAQLNSLGAISLENNRMFSAAFAELIAEHDIPDNRYYINFFDVPRENCGFKAATFAG
eukprot:jgi/Ulvmu1/2233/UM013_0080.1